MKTALQKHTLHFFEGDFEELKNLYPSVSATIIIRTLVRRHIEKVKGGQTELKIEVDL